MGKDEIKAIIKETISELQIEKSSTLCCGGLKESERDKVQGWTQQGDLFTPEQTEALKGFADAIYKAKKYIIIGFGIIAVLALRDMWGAVWHFIQNLFHRGGGTWT